MDLIDRQDAIEHIKKRLYESAENNIGLMCMADHVFTEIADNRINTWIEELPSAQKTGKWTIEDCHAATYKYCCSECKAHHRARYDYCPTCGARMVGDEE